jgi:hypothetical protein
MSIVETGEDHASRDAQLSQELEALQREREDIISGVAIASAADLARVTAAFERKIQATNDARAYQMSNLRLHFELEKKLALDEMILAKARLREQIIVTYVERKKKFDAIRAVGGGGTFLSIASIKHHANILKLSNLSVRSTCISSSFYSFLSHPL